MIPVADLVRRRRSPRGFANLPVELFRTDRGWYAFDAKKVQFAELDEVSHDLLALLRDRDVSDAEAACLLLPRHPAADVREAWDELASARAEGFFSRYPFRRSRRHDIDDYESMLTEQMAGLTLSITTRCNLACSYCIYGGQYEQHPELDREVMSWETARNAMDFLAANSARSERLQVDFFGGEPLLAFPLIEKAVAYLEALVADSGRKVVVTVTSNGTVLTERMIDFLVERGVFLQVSIDGDRQTHDRSRVFRGGRRGSFDVILRNLQRLHDRAPDYYATKLRIKGVINNDNWDADERALFEHPLVAPLVAEQHISFLEQEPHYDCDRDTDYFQRLELLGAELLQREGAETLDELLAPLTGKQRYLFWHTFGEFFDVQAKNKVYFGDDDAVPFVRGCVTGYKEGHVDPSGNISVCLKAKGGDFVIGNVNEGRWYFDRMRALDAALHGTQPCSGCFAQRFCDLCYQSLDGGHGKLVTSRAKFCEFARARYRVIFATMLRVLESNPGLWQEVDRRIAAKLDARTQEQSLLA